jgi:hypothetical protein
VEHVLATKRDVAFDDDLGSFELERGGIEPLFLEPSPYQVIFRSFLLYRARRTTERAGQCTHPHHEYSEFHPALLGFGWVRLDDSWQTVNPFVS